MAQQRGSSPKRQVEQYKHKDKERLNNPPAGLVTPETDPDAGQKKTYAYDPHLDPQLVWAGKAEHTSFEVPTVSLHVHERIDPSTIIEAVLKRNGEQYQPSLFETPEENPPIRQAVEFYKHAHGWSNRLIAGDSLLVMNSLLEKEGLAGKVQMIYIDPPYGIKYGSNFQPFVNKRDVKDGKDEDLTAEPEQIRAFRDTWELGIHSYLTYLRDRLLLARELLTESGSVFVQISDENVHHVRELMDEVFETVNFVSLIAYTTTGGFPSKTISRAGDYLVWYAKDVSKIKYCAQYVPKQSPIGDPASKYDQIEEPDGRRRAMTLGEKRGETPLPAGSRIYRLDNIQSQGAANDDTPFDFGGRTYRPKPGSHWKANYPDGMERLKIANRIQSSEDTLNYVRFFDDFPVAPINNMWHDIGGSVQSRSDPKVFVVQTGTSVLQRCLLMTTDPGDLVFDPTCGSGTTAYVAEQWGRRWITCDTSRVAITLAKQRLMTAVFDYYELAHPEEGVGSGFKYKTVPHITLKSIANNPDIKEGMTREEIDAAIARHAETETLYDQPFVDRKRVRVTGPFTVEAVPAPAVKSVEDLLEDAPQPADASVARSGETLRQAEWRDELLRTGIRGKAGQYIRFPRLEPLPGCRWLHADGETHEDKPQRVVVSFGPEHAPLEQRQVALAIEEAQTLVPRPKLIVFAAFQFDPEAAKDIDETKWPGVTLLKVQMNADLLTEDLKKKRASNESFWLIGQPDVQVERITKGEHAGKMRVSVNGFDYYNTLTGNIESGGPERIAMWLLDTDYDGRSLYPRQVFFPMAGDDEGWAKLARNLRAEIDPDLIEAYRGTVSLPFGPGEHKRIAVKIVDNRGIESLKVLEVD
jgi:adenine-specific DNA-methyltransferase